MKQNKKAIVFIAILLAGLVACRKITDIEQRPGAALAGNEMATFSQGVLDPKAQLGKRIFFDANLSSPAGSQSCASCHMPQVGFFGLGDVTPGGLPRGFVGGIGEGAVAGRFGNRKPPSAAYATYSPILRFATGDNEFIGGLFWDGRATGATLGSPAAEQALGPFLNPNEHNLPNKKAVLDKLAASPEYQTMWNSVWGEPITTNNTTQINLNYDRVGLSVAAYEGSDEVNQFSSKYDAYLRGQAQLTMLEQEGLILFNEKAECYDCHSGVGTAANPPLFTDFSYANIGVPRNPLNPVYATNPGFIDNGLGGFLNNHANRTWRARAKENMGKFKSPTLRNVGKAKRFMHNGVFTSLEQVVHFYNTRDVKGAGWNGIPWGAPEVAVNMAGHQKMGNLGLTAREEAAIVAFLRTLDDGWVPGTETTQH